ncbi:MAG: hypothetical protein HY647_08620 [Acidobacteria bacterium]|nr:hypothetical protein [Acidobacteriota bacterium]
MAWCSRNKRFSEEAYQKHTLQSDTFLRVFGFIVFLFSFFALRNIIASIFADRSGTSVEKIVAPEAATEYTLSGLWLSAALFALGAFCFIKPQLVWSFLLQFRSPGNDLSDLKEGEFKRGIKLLGWVLIGMGVLMLAVWYFNID